MLSEKEVKKLLTNARARKSTAKKSGSDETYRLWCKAEKLLERILEIKPKKKDRRIK